MHKFSAYRKDGTLAWTASIKKNEIEAYTLDYCARGFWVEVVDKPETEEEKDTRLGKTIISVLSLTDSRGRIWTADGYRSPMGLARLMARILADKYEE